MQTGTHPEILHPIRRADIARLASDVRARIAGLSIDEIAEQEDILLIRTPGPRGRDDGRSELIVEHLPVFIESLAVPGEAIPLWGVRLRRFLSVIFLNENSSRPEREIFWHEYYHIRHSPLGVQRVERFRDSYSTEAALHHHEERRANDFAVAMLVPSIVGFRDASEIAWHYSVSEELAEHAVRYYRAISKANR